MTTAAAWLDAPGIIGQFRARIYQLGAAPDADGDIILADASGSDVAVSLEGHDVIKSPGLEPAGEARLERHGDAMIAVGAIYGTPRGRALRVKLLTEGERQEWSVGFRATQVRKPTPAELARWPDAKRVIERWDVLEISPVRAGACGPHCRTLPGKSRGGTVEVKCAGACTCLVAPTPTARDLALFEQNEAAVKHVCPARPTADEVDRCEARSAELKKAPVPAGLRVARIWEEPPTHTVELLERAAAAAANDLGVPTPAVKFFVAPDHLNGVYSKLTPDVIWLRVQRNPWDMLRVAGHEVFHLAERERGSRANESAAQVYGEKLLRSDQRFWPSSVQLPDYDEHGARLL